MTKWADFLISAVVYDAERQITFLKRHRDTGDEIGPGEIIDKATVASDIDKGISYMTIFSTLSNWKLGENIHLSHVDNHYCLRIDENKVKHDNLGPLAELPDILEDDSQKTKPKKILIETESQISPGDKAMLKNMGARQHDSIKSFESKPKSESISYKKSETYEKSKDDILSEYEKDYLKRLGIQDQLHTEHILEPPHGTLPKGFDEKSTAETKPEPEPPKPEVLEPPHGTLPKGFDEKSTAETKPEPEPPKPEVLEPPHGTLPKGFDEKSTAETKPEPEPPKPEVLEPPHGTLPKGFDEKSTAETKPEPEPPKPEVLEPPHGTLPKGFDEKSTAETKPEPEPPKPEPEPPKPEVLESPHGTLPKQTQQTSKVSESTKLDTDVQSKELNELEKQIGDLKKAVEELDESKNTSTRSSSNTSSNVQAYCVKCKKKIDVQNPVQSELKNGRPAIRGTCPVCKTRVCRLGKLNI